MKLFTLKILALTIACALFTAACMPTQSAVPATNTSSPESPLQADEPSVPTTQSALPTPEADTSAPDTSAGSAEAHQDYVWVCAYCGTAPAWQFENGTAQQFELPIEVAYAYGYSPATGRLLYSGPTEPIGGGPSQISVHNLWLLDVASGQATPIFEETVVVEADLAPDGEHFAYVLATDATYELRWREIGGEDKLLASDVAFTFAIAPAGDKVAFTRESNYDLPGIPGLYVVDVASGEEIRVADADRAGMGSIDDRPAWSPSGDRILLPISSTPAAPSLVLAATDGRGAVRVDFDPALRDEDWYQAMLSNPHWVTDTQFLASAAPGMSQQMGGELHLYLFDLNEAGDTIIAGAEVGAGVFAGWDVPGESIWVQVGPEMQSVPLPELSEAR